MKGEPGFYKSEMATLRGDSTTGCVADQGCYRAN
jgi:hypothetical protein